MLSSEWWRYHLTKDGWVEGDSKQDFEGEVERPMPTGTLFSRRYYEKIPHPSAPLKRGYDDESDISDEAKALLKQYPHPNGFRQFE